MTEQLKALAEAAKGWKFDHIQQCDDEPIEVGQMSDGEFYQIATIDCEQYGESSRPLAEYLVQASPERILALIAENERLQRIADDFQNRWNSERQINESQISGGRYPDGTPAW